MHLVVQCLLIVLGKKVPKCLNVWVFCKTQFVWVFVCKGNIIFSLVMRFLCTLQKTKITGMRDFKTFCAWLAWFSFFGILQSVEQDCTWRNSECMLASSKRSQHGVASTMCTRWRRLHARASECHRASSMKCFCHCNMLTSRAPPHVVASTMSASATDVITPCQMCWVASTTCASATDAITPHPMCCVASTMCASAMDVVTP